MKIDTHPLQKEETEATATNKKEGDPKRIRGTLSIGKHQTKTLQARKQENQSLDLKQLPTPLDETSKKRNTWKKHKSQNKYQRSKNS